MCIVMYCVYVMYIYINNYCNEMQYVLVLIVDFIRISIIEIPEIPMLNFHVFFPIVENYHQVYDNLSHLKIQCLEEAREEAKQRYRTHQEQYVITCLGKPLDKLSTFFEGVERLLGTGMKPEQIGFYRDYNKAELLKCIQHYPGKEVSWCTCTIIITLLQLFISL